MRRFKAAQSALIASLAVLCGAAFARPDLHAPATRPFIATGIGTHRVASTKASAGGGIAAATETAVGALQNIVGRLSHPRALEDAFHGYFAYKALHPDEVKKPLPYFVDYCQPSTARRGWVFDMSSLKVVDGPFTVAHGRGSASANATLPTTFSNLLGSATTSLG